MNYYAPRQRRDGRWDYTRKNNNDIWPEGYCSKYTEWWIYLEKQGWPCNAEEKTCYEKHKDKHHTDGHATAEEASQCYRQYLLDHSLRLGEKCSEGERHRCKICGRWTQLYATVVNHSIWDLCEEHNNREEVEELFEAPDWICSSM